MTVNRTASAGRDYAENSDLCDIRVEPGPAGRPRHGAKRPAPDTDAPAAAPDQPRQPTDNEIVVTGTLIKGIAPVGTNVVGVSHADIASSGATTALGVMATVPEISNAFNALPTPAQA
jgi:iron complex outermembrane receptor protein